MKEIIHATVNEPSTASDEARLKRVFDAALAERPKNSLQTKRRSTQLEALPPKKQRRANTKGELWTVCELAPACPGGNINTGHILRKGYESILWMVLGPALPDKKTCSAGSRIHMFVHHGELRYGTMGLIEFSFSAAAEKERDRNIITVTLSVSVPRKYCSSRTEPTCEGHTLLLAVLRWDGRDLAENLMEIFTDRMYSFTPTAERETAREPTLKIQLCVSHTVLHEDYALPHTILRLICLAVILLSL